MIRRAAARLYRSSTGVLVVTTAGTMVVRMVSTVTLTRLLTPDVFGIVGIISSIFYVIAMLTDLGFQAFVVRHPQGDDARFLDVIWTVHVSRGIALTILAILTAPLVGMLLGKPEIVWPLAAASLTMAINGAASLSLITALRTNGASKLFLLDLVLAAFLAFTGIVLAILLRNVWAIIIGMIAHSVVRLILSYALFPAARRRFARDQAWSREFWIFSRVVLTSSFLRLLIGQSDKLVLARLFTLAQFGLYSLAINLVTTASAFVGTYVSRVLFPIYARTWNEAREELPKVYYASQRRVSRLYALGSGGMIGAAPLIVAVLYDPRYALAALYLALLSVGSVLTLPNLAAAELMTATGEIKITLYGNILRVVWLCVAGLAGYLALGAVGLIAAVGLIEVPVLFYNWSVLRRIRVLDMRQELAYLAIALAGAGIGFLVSSVILRLRPGL